MVTINPQFITDAKGVKLNVALPIKDFEAMLEELVELEDIKLYDEALKSNQTSIPIDEAFKMIEDNLSQA